MRYVLLIAVLLAGCATPEQRADKAAEKFGPYCERLGLKAKTPEWAQCVQSEVTSRRMAN
jgi:hypothetical protein